MSVKNTVSLISEDANLLKSLTSALKSASITLIGFASVKEYIDGLADGKPHGALLVKGLDTLKDAMQHPVAVPIIVLVSVGDVASAVQAIKAGAFDAVETSGKEEALVESARKAISARSCRCSKTAAHASISPSNSMPSRPPWPTPSAS